MDYERNQLACLFAAAALLSGCSVSGITADVANPPVPAAWARGGDAGTAGSNWLATFNDPQLEQLVGEAVTANYLLTQERERLELARQGVIVTRSSRFPVLDVSIDGQRRGSEDAAGNSFVVESFDAAVSGRWDVDIWRRLSKQQQAAELALAAQEARLLAVERDIAGTTASQLFNAMEATQLLQVAERRLANAIESHDIVASGYRQGLNDALDLYLARNQLERQQANFAQQQQLQLEAVANLQLSLARYPDGQLPIAGELPIIDDAIPAGLPSDLLTRRPDIQEAWLSLLAADADLAAAHRARFPNLTIVGSDGVTSSEFSDLLSNGASAWSLTFGLTQPLFNAGRLKASQAQALSRVRIAEQQYLDLVYRAFAAVENSISRSTSLTQRYSALVEAEKNSRAALELALEQYQRGLVPYTTVLESQRQAFDAETTVVQLRNQRVQNRITLYLALGGEFQ
ncbi:MAG: efflux transporter outer membrane subunit [Woeseia sp.]